jgi:hypothetical protein
MKKGRKVDKALRRHPLVLRELPAEVIVRRKIVVTRESGEQILARLRGARPTRALRKLMGGSARLTIAPADR